MSAWADAPALRAFFARVARRLAWIAAAEGAAIGLAIALIAVIAGWPGRGSIALSLIVGFTLAAAGMLVRLVSATKRSRGLAHLIERRAPACRNLIVTAAELIDRPARFRPQIGALVCREAARVAARLDPRTLFPARNAITALGASATLWTLAVTFIAAQPAVLRGTLNAAVESAAIERIDVDITPPEYSARPAQALRDPARIEALAGSRIHLTVSAAAAGVTIETIGGSHALEATGSRTFEGVVLADADGYIAIEPTATDGRAGVRNLIGLSVTTDAAPGVRVTAPGRDLFFPDAQRTIGVVVEAEDDLGLQSLVLRYTKVSGSGEQFTFEDGTVPLEIARANDRSWTGRGSLRLDGLRLVAGDVIVYRAAAADRRPGATPTESDAFLVEITAPGAVAAEGFAIDDERDRYAVSQQMVILKTERLIARASSVPPDSVAHESLTIAAEQRAVRAEFVFMMGGELAEEVLEAAGITDLNEEAHAEADDEIIAGRLANQGRGALIQAIRSMSRANAALTSTNLTRALVEERAALGHLQSAFARTRYILRALTQRERLDLTRRLTGTLTEAQRAVRTVLEPARAARATALRSALSGIAALAGGSTFDDNAPAGASDLAQTVLRVDPSAAELQQVAAQLTEAAAAIAERREAEARSLLEEATVSLVAVVRAGLVEAPSRPTTLEAGQLEGALTDALRRAGGVR